ncbi:hypothetical protein CL634_08800 [bacterium]|nr:hypothetical protein [bacterium]|tara:strand:+ start:575 stop:970 length:396 start_codon:yes stop_codon:yes gene_type:complete
MTDKEMLGTIHRWINQSLQRDEPEMHERRLRDCKNFIEQEWQKQDDELGEWRNEVFAKSDDGQMYNMNEQDVNENSAGEGAHADSYGQFSDTWYKDDKRHRGLKIGPDGSVTGIKGEYEPTSMEDFGPVGD